MRGLHGAPHLLPGIPFPLDTGRLLGGVRIPLVRGALNNLKRPCTPFISASVRGLFRRLHGLAHRSPSGFSPDILRMPFPPTFTTKAIVLQPLGAV